ncbi:MAG: hypothetical protein K1X57_19005, partial [Gemmataceae bacterium]|nr:hypothetical protein [Gemmataceae bacterium]
AGGAGISVTANGVGSSVTGSTFTGSRSTSSGGSISTSGGTLSITDTTISGGSASGNGGAVRFSGSLGTLTVLRSTISGNTSTSASGGGFYLGDHTVTITDSTLSGNTVTGSVGGGAIMSYTATITLTNSTVSGNAASGAAVQGGGGIRFSGDGILTVDNSTIVNNSVGSGKGGGIGLNTANALVTITSSILAKNVGLIGPDLYSNSTVPMNVLVTDSIIGAVTDADITLIETNVQKGTLASPFDPKITVLGNNGGPTQTHALAFGSPAIDMGSNSLTLTNDQRGAGFSRVLGTKADIGAFEGVAAIPQAFATAPDVTVSGGTTFTVSATYTDDVGINLSSIDLNDITVTAPNLATLVPVSFSTTGSGNVVNVSYVFAAPGGTWDALDGGTYAINVVAGQVFDLDTTPNSVAPAQLGSFKVTIPSTLLVDLATDENDGDLSAGDLSLREAILFANSIKNTADVINFAPVLGGQTITLTLGEIAITDPLTINGLGATKLAISGNNASRIFNISDLDTAVNMVVSINDLTLRDGKNSSTITIGGAIFQSGDTLNLTNCIVTNNTNPIATNGRGGAIGMTRSALTENQTLNATNCVFTNNTVTGTAGNGGAIDGGSGGAKITIVNCSITGNSTTGNGGFLSAAYPTITIRGTTITGNTANNGGAITPYKAAVTIENSTISANTAKALGGGIYVTNARAGDTFTLRNSTVTANTAGTNGGGFHRNAGTGIFNFNSSIIAGNLNANTPDVNFNAAAVVDGENNLIGVADVGNFTLSGAINLTGGLGTPLDPVLAPLADNGGAVVLPDGSHTKTHAFAGVGPALNAGSNTASLTFDQRGNARVVGGVADIGAFEQQAPAKFSSVVINNGAAQRSMVTQVKVNFNQHVAFTAGAAAAFTLNRVSDNAAVNLSAVVDDSGSGTAVTLTFTGGAVSGASLADGRYALHILASGFGAEGFDGNGDGTAAGSPADDFFFDQPADPAPLDGAKIFRLFGDSDGSGQVSSADFLAFRLAFLSSSVTFDADGNGQVDSSDFLAFRLNFLKTI